MTPTPATPDLRLVPELLRGRVPTFLAIYTLSLLSGAASLAVPLVSAQLIDTLQNGGDMMPLAAALVALGLVATVGAAAASYLLARASQTMLKYLRIRTITRAVRGRLRDVERHGSGNVSARMTNDAAQVKSFLEIAPVHLPVSVITLVATLAIMAFLDWALLSITLASFALAFLVIGSVVLTIRRGHVQLQTVQGRLAQAVVGAMDSLPLIKASRAEQHVIGTVAEDCEEVRRVETALARATSFLAPTLTLAQQVALVGVLIGGGARLVNGSLSLAALVAFLMYLLQLAAPLMGVVGGLSGIQAGLAAKTRFGEILGTPQEDSRPAPLPRSGTDVPALRLTGVDFRYDEHTPALSDIDLVVPRTGLTAVVGGSGAGKSTLLALIDRLYDADAGSIHLLGHDITRAPAGLVRGSVSYLDQSFALVEGTVRDNLTLGSDTGHLGDDTLWAALDRVGLEEAIEALPLGLDSPLGLGADLSGGQRQRLALARLLLDPREVVLLDEPSSQLDPISEARLRETVEILARERAVVVIAHRLSTVASADWVVVMEDGRAVSQGTHEELARDCPVYQRQFGWAPAPTPVPA